MMPPLNVEIHATLMIRDPYSQADTVPISQYSVKSPRCQLLNNCISWSKAEKGELIQQPIGSSAEMVEEM